MIQIPEKKISAIKTRKKGDFVKFIIYRNCNYFNCTCTYCSIAFRNVMLIIVIIESISSVALTLYSKSEGQDTTSI